MKHLLIFGFVAVALLAAATTLRSLSIYIEPSATTIGLASSKKTSTASGVSKLPVEDFEDMSLVFSTPAKQ